MLSRESYILRRIYSLNCAIRLVPYLEKVGYIESQLRNVSVDKNGRAVPWWPYCFTEYLGPKLNNKMTVFEYGSGSSTLWLSERVKEVVSCEHDYNYYAMMQRNMPKNVKYLFLEKEKYSSSIGDYDIHFDIVVVDGIDRVLSIKKAVDKIGDSGVLILDNSDKKKYEEAITFMEKRGFKQLSFEGLVALQTWSNKTTVFYRTINCLGI